MRAKIVIRDDEVRASVVQDVTHLGRLQEIVDGHDDGAGMKDAKERRDKLRTILHPQSHAIARPDAKLLAEHRGDEQRLAPEFGI